jgi:hypothetical protein
MIIRGITEQATSQNWFSVIVEFVIVVVGVFMGLQVQDWNEERRTRADTLVGVNPVLFSQEPSPPLKMLRSEARLSEMAREKVREGERR